MILLRRRLKPTRLPHPVLDAHTEAFFSGIGVGVVLAAAIAVIFLGGAGLLRAVH